ncbi:hypothetical protein ILUMI_10225 [Ignelater luminosus]|uniref:Uncharacterized protein n=1 Tax=Ignelater luminosus TaxID=2038154 RepID=A0A8K0GBP2_IGNLU|nr:hypothetical protein ILUMI_10225 [Ignelater luminosus]
MNVAEDKKKDCNKNISLHKMKTKIEDLSEKKLSKFATEVYKYTKIILEDYLNTNINSTTPPSDSPAGENHSTSKEEHKKMKYKKPRDSLNINVTPTTITGKNPSIPEEEEYQTVKYKKSRKRTRQDSEKTSEVAVENKFDILAEENIEDDVIRHRGRWTFLRPSSQLPEVPENLNKKTILQKKPKPALKSRSMIPTTSSPSSPPRLTKTCGKVVVTTSASPNTEPLQDFQTASSPFPH